MSKLRVLASGKHELRLEYDDVGRCNIVVKHPDGTPLRGMLMPAGFADDLATFLLGIDSWEERTDEATS